MRKWKYQESWKTKTVSDGTYSIDLFAMHSSSQLIWHLEQASFIQKGHLILSLASKEDIFLFKGITEREADLDDMRLLAESSLDWRVIKTECRNQSLASGRLWENALLQNLVDLRTKYHVRSPIEKELQRIVEEKLSEDLLIKLIANGHTTIRNISKAANLPDYLVREYTEKMAQKGILKIDKTNRPYKFSLV
jgi:hypothetical protein